MKIFISWSGAHSRLVAEAIREWLPYVLPSAQPWMSSTDIDRGSRWNVEIAEQLDNANIGIICLTQQNLEAPWILFEAGALSKALSRALVCTYLYQVQPVNIKGPLSQFQSTCADKDDTHKLLITMNRALGADAVPTERLSKSFDVWWPELEHKLAMISKTGRSSVAPHRSDRDILEELLALQRKNDNRALASELAALILTEIRLKPIGALDTDRTPVAQNKKARPSTSDSTVIVDTRPLLGDSGSLVSMHYPLFITVSDFLDCIYGHVMEKVPISTFGRRWALRDIESMKEFREMGRTWANENLNRIDDNRSLRDLGIVPGMRLEAIPVQNTELNGTSEQVVPPNGP